MNYGNSVLIFCDIYANKRPIKKNTKPFGKRTAGFQECLPLYQASVFQQIDITWTWRSQPFPMGLHNMEKAANKVVMVAIAFTEERSIKTFSSQAN